MRRYLAVHLPSVRIELVRPLLSSDEQRKPLAVVVARPGGAVTNERSLLGNTKVDEVCPLAHREGVRPSMTIAAARAKSSELRVRVVASDAVIEALEKVAEAGLSLGMTAALDTSIDVVHVDVTGSAHLVGGERNLARTFIDLIARLGFSSRVAIADGKYVATSLARFARRKEEREGAPPIFLVKPGESALAIRFLPLSALPLGEESRRWLEKVGMKCAGDLQKLPPEALGTRLGQDAKQAMALLRGEDDAPLDPFVPREVPEEKVDLEYGIEATEPLLFVCKVLCDRLSARLDGRVEHAARLELEMKLDRGVIRESQTLPVAILSVVLPVPFSLARDLLAVLRTRVESFVIEAPILAVTLRASEVVPRVGRALDMFVPEAKAERALPRLAAELAAELGDDKVGTLALVDTWLPEERSRLMPYGASHPEAANLSNLASSAVEPTRFSRARTRCDELVHSTEQATLIARIEAPEWWRVGVVARDYVGLWLPDSRQMAWLEIDHASGDTFLRGWLEA